MHAVLGIDDKLRPSLGFHNLIHASRAIALRRLVVHRQVVANRQFGIAQHEVAGLIFFVVGVG